MQSGAEAGFGEGLALERELQQLLFQSDDAKEGIAANLEKRKPQFQGRRERDACQASDMSRHATDAHGIDRKQLLIGGEWRDAAGGKTMPVVNPATEEVIARRGVGRTRPTSTPRSRRRARRSTGRGARCRRASAAGSSGSSASG